MDSRQQFEEWVNSQCPGADLRLMGDNNESYVNAYVREQWTGWQASRESLVVKLPSKPCYRGYAAYEDAMDDAKKAIERQGITCK